MAETVLMTAYAVNPYKGSEDGTGWNITREVAKDFKAIVITRKNNIPHITKYIAENLEDIHAETVFIGYDLHPLIMWLKKRLGERGYVIYYYLWQLFLPTFVRKQKLKFDIAHAVNFHSDSVPTFLWRLGKPTFWGPVGHHPAVPKQFLKGYGKMTVIRDRFYFLLKWCLRNLDPFFRIAVKRVDRIFVINSGVASAMGVAESKVVSVPAVASDPPSQKRVERKEGFTVLSVGRFHYMKGFDLTIRAFARFLKKLEVNQQQKACLILVGKGEEKNFLSKIANEEGVKDNMEWIEWVDRSKMDDLYRSADVFLFPSHEGAGMVVPEALSFKLPVVCLDNFGPGELVGSAGLKVPYGSYDKVVNELSSHLHKLYTSNVLYEELSNKAINRYRSNFRWEAKGNVIKRAYQFSAQKKVVVFHPSSELYGADRILINALQAMPEEINKTVFLKFEGPLIRELESRVENVQVRVLPFMPVIYRGIFHPKGMLAFGRDWMRFVLFFRREMRKNRFHSAYVNTLSTSFLLPILWCSKLRSYVHVHEIIESPKIIGKLTARLCYYFSQYVICVSEAVQENLLAYVPSLKKKTKVIYNGIEPIDVPVRTVNERLNFFLFGRIMEKKGQWFLVDALERLEESERKQLKVILMGGAVPGQETSLDQLKSKINRAGLKGVVELKGFAPNISQAMAQADVCLVPSMMKDPFPTTVLEAMSAGRPIIATDHGGAREAISDCGGGFLIKPGMTDQLVGSIRSIIQRKSQIPVMGMRAKRRFTSAFTIEHFNQNWRSFLIDSKLV
ncbi:MAG: glycosyltransferase [Flavobacteriales bacterium]|nr:glycosyltransferase [Flavobacteriales bacterium]